MHLCDHLRQAKLTVEECVFCFAFSLMIRTVFFCSTLAKKNIIINIVVVVVGGVIVVIDISIIGTTHPERGVFDPLETGTG